MEETSLLVGLFQETRFSQTCFWNLLSLVGPKSQNPGHGSSPFHRPLTFLCGSRVAGSQFMRFSKKFIRVLKIDVDGGDKDNKGLRISSRDRVVAVRYDRTHFTRT